MTISQKTESIISKSQNFIKLNYISNNNFKNQFIITILYTGEKTMTGGRVNVQKNI